MNSVMDFIGQVVAPPVELAWSVLSSWWFLIACVASAAVGAFVTRGDWVPGLAQLLSAVRRAGSNARHRAVRKDRS